MHSYECLTWRHRGVNTFLQRVVVHEDGSTTVPESSLEPTGTWSVQTRQLTPEEMPAVLYFKYNYMFRDTSIVLVNSEQPDTFLRLIERAVLNRPPTYVNGVLVKGLQIPVAKIVDGGGLDALNEFIQNQRIRCGHQDPPEGYVCTSVSEVIRTEIRDFPDVSEIEQALNNLAAMRHRAIKPPPALNSMVARLVAEAARNTNEICPISMDSMTTCKTLYVPTCGHVCSDEGCLALLTCPICRARTSWTSVEFA
jgi:hypothetical protein